MKSLQASGLTRYDTPMNETLIDLQTRAAFQEDTIEQLSRIVANQQQTLDAVQRELRQLRELVFDLKRNLPEADAQEAPPPHY